MAARHSDAVSEWVTARARASTSRGVTPLAGCALTLRSSVGREHQLPQWVVEQIDANCPTLGDFDDAPDLRAVAVEHWPRALGDLYEAQLGAGIRRSSGSHYTPVSVARGLVREALAISSANGSAGRILDPACGGGAFLLALGEALLSRGIEPSAVWRNVVGVDIDDGAATVANWARALQFVVAGHVAAIGEPTVTCGDFLHGDQRTDLDDLAVVIGNPPFVSPLRGQTGPERQPPLRNSKRLGPYGDIAARFVERSVEIVAPGGVVCLILPHSVAGSRDAVGVREFADRECDLRAVWCDGERLFSASVRVFAPVLVRPRANQPRASGIAPMALRGPDAAATPLRLSAERAPGRWTPLLAAFAGLPSAAAAHSAPAGALLDATAGFRDEFYACAAAAVERSGTHDERPHLVTSGLIDPGVSRWGRDAARINRRRFDEPVVDLPTLAHGDHPKVLRWVEARLIPKVVVAVQTAVIEAAIDDAGILVPLTPVIAVQSEELNLFEVFAALSNPVSTAWAWSRGVGLGMGETAMRITAASVADLPVPTDRGAWRDAADGLREAAATANGADRLPIDAVIACGHRMATAMGASDDAVRFWEQRVRRIRDRRVTAPGKDA